MNRTLMSCTFAALCGVSALTMAQGETDDKAATPNAGPSLNSAKSQPGEASPGEKQAERPQLPKDPGGSATGGKGSDAKSEAGSNAGS
ncbi:hypothetical protein ABQX22_05875 [Xanthomonas sp. WHRI 1810A]|uniref:hypothetical protein n=1 Tax=Xanthomonas sp. WHRI 1810A TaxID=3161565 RepID=UPI0032E8FA3A